MHVHRLNLITNWYLKCYFLSEWRPWKLIARITHNHLKITMSLSQNLKQQGTLIKATIETDRQDRPRFGYRQDAMHWNITKFLILLQETPTQPPVTKTQSMLNKEPLYSSTMTKVDTPHGTQGTCV